MLRQILMFPSAVWYVQVPVRKEGGGGLVVQSDCQCSGVCGKLKYTSYVHLPTM
jgi:hypothetical protein